MSNESVDTLKMVREQASRLIKANSSPERLKELLDEPGAFDADLWGAASESGWSSITAPEEHGGLGLDWQGLCILMEQVGETTASIPLVSNAVAAKLLIEDGASSWTKDHIENLVMGYQVACLAFSEAQGSTLDADPATSFDDGKVTGSKSISAFAAVADLALVTVLFKGKAELALVPLNDDKVKRCIRNSFDNSRAYASLEFDEAPAFLLKSTTEHSAIEKAVALAALATSFEQIGGAQSSMAMARNFALERKAFGQPIGSFQAIKHKIANMYWRIEIARGCALDALDAYQNHSQAWLTLAAAARLSSTEAYEFSAKENIQTHGGLGVTWEAMPHHFYRRSRTLAIELGSTHYWRDRLLSEAGFDANR